MIIMLFAVRYSFPPVSVEPSIAPHPKSYMEVNCCLAVHIPPSAIPQCTHQPLSLDTRRHLSACYILSSL